jgi:hypothetical protein
VFKEVWMKRGAIAVALVLVLGGARQLAAEPLNKSVDVSLTFAQGAYSENWVGGEVATVSWMFTSNSLLEKQINEKLNTKSTLKLSFGQQHNQDQETRDWREPLKVNDLIDFETVLRVTLGWCVDPFASVRLESQFLDQSDLANERLVNPIRLTESIGIAKVLIKEDKREWSLRLGGAFRQLVDRDRRDATTELVETKWTNDGGVQFVSDFMTPLGDTTRMFASKIYVYRAFFSSEADKLAGLPNEHYWEAPDVNWENILSAAVTKHIVFVLYVQLLYDKEVDLAGRFKETLGLGLTYKLF